MMSIEQNVSLHFGPAPKISCCGVGDRERLQAAQPGESGHPTVTLLEHEKNHPVTEIDPYGTMVRSRPRPCVEALERDQPQERASSTTAACREEAEETSIPSSYIATIIVVCWSVAVLLKTVGWIGL